VLAWRQLGLRSAWLSAFESAALLVLLAQMSAWMSVHLSAQMSAQTLAQTLAHLSAQLCLLLWPLATVMQLYLLALVCSLLSQLCQWLAAQVLASLAQGCLLSWSGLALALLESLAQLVVQLVASQPRQLVRPGWALPPMALLSGEEAWPSR